MRKSLVCFCHSEGFFFLIESSARGILGVDDFSSETCAHCAFASCSGIANKPTETESLTAFGSYFHRNLIVGAAYTTSLNFENRHNVLKSFLECFKRVLTEFFFNFCECVVNDLLSNALLTVVHYIVDKLCYELGIVKRIRKNVSFRYLTSS